MYSRERSVQFASKTYCDDRAKGSVYFPLFHKASSFYAVSLYTCIYVLNVYIDMRSTVIVIYVLQSLYIYI